MPSKYARIDDQAIHYLHAGASTLPDVVPPLDRGAALLFVHGEGGSAPLWSRQLASLGAGHSPVAVDLPGHGRSCGLDAPASVGEAARLVVAFLAALGAPPAVLVGHGLGGQIALAAALEWPERVRAVVTIGTSAHPEIDPALIEQLRDVARGRIGQQFDTPLFGAAPDVALVREVWGEMAKNDPRVRLGDLLAYRASDLSPRLGRLSRPALLLQGDQDRLCPMEAAEQLAAAIPDARLERVSGAGHVAHLERAAEVCRAIESFVAAR